jgi:copper chaperone CopZ
MLKYILTVFAVLSVLSASVNAKIQTYKFVTLGNCYSCTMRIEEATQNIAGLDSAYYDYDTDITTVKFDDEIITINQIMHIVANCGHDTEWYPAPDGAYFQLVGTCCEYQRTIDYSQAKVGYLSLMDMWLSVFDAINTNANVFPNVINNGIINISLSRNADVNPIAKIYDLNGTLVRSEELNSFGVSAVNITGIPSGKYFVLLEINNNPFFRTIVTKL